MVEPPWFIKHGLVVIGGRDLGLPRATAEQIIADVRGFHRDSALAVLLRLNLTLTHPHPLSQAELVGRWLPDAAEKFLAAVRERGATEVFHEAQVLNLIRLVILFASADTGRQCNTRADFALLAKLLLQLTDILVEREGATETERRDWVFRNFTRAELFMHDEHFVPDVMARNYDLFVLVPHLLRGVHTYDLPGTFAQVTGIEVRDYIGLGFGLLTNYDVMPANTFGDGAIGVDRSRFFADVRVPADVHGRMWPLVSKSLNEYRAALQVEWDRTTGASRFAAMRTFTQHPMIELPSGSVVAVSRRMLRDRITHGIYWIMANGVPPEQRQDFTNFFGHVFESYVCRALTRAAGRGFRWGLQYDGADHGKRPEGAVMMPRSVGFIEAKARRLLLNVREIGGVAELEAAVREGLDEAAAQIATAIDAGQRRALSGIETNDKTLYYPLIITYEPLPSHPLAMKVYDDIIHKDGRLRGGAVKPATLLNTRDIESLEGLIWNGAAWPDLLTRKHTPRHATDSFHNFLYRALGGEFPRNEYLALRWERIGDMIGNRLFGESLSHSERLPQRHRRRPRRR